jgi:hypothetical protein
MKPRFARHPSTPPKMLSFLLVFVIWMLIGYSVMIGELFYYRDVDFAMQTDAPHWSDPPILKAVWFIIMLPHLLIARFVIFLVWLFT